MNSPAGIRTIGPVGVRISSSWTPASPVSFSASVTVEPLWQDNPRGSTTIAHSRTRACNQRVFDWLGFATITLNLLSTDISHLTSYPVLLHATRSALLTGLNFFTGFFPGHLAGLRSVSSCAGRRLDSSGSPLSSRIFTKLRDIPCPKFTLRQPQTLCLMDVLPCVAIVSFKVVGKRTLPVRDAPTLGLFQ